MVSLLPSGLPTTRGAGAPIPGMVATFSTAPDRSALTRWIVEAPKLATYTLPSFGPNRSPSSGPPKSRLPSRRPRKS